MQYASNPAATAAETAARMMLLVDDGDVGDVADVHHHQNIFNGEILKPLLPALERICPE